MNSSYMDTQAEHLTLEHPDSLLADFLADLTCAN